jgi:inorganic triphosphatase YgiF
MPVEAELKLSVRPEHAARIGRHPVVRKLKTGRASTKHMVGTYFDTPDLLLRRREMSLRVRAVDRRFIQTLKRMKPAQGAILERDEWEADVAGESPDISKLEASAVRQIFAADGVAASLRPLFKTDVQRTVWRLRDADAEIELALDVGEIRDQNGGRVPVCEAELELKAGDARRLYDVALALNDRVDCTVSGLAKSERGYALYRKEVMVPVKASRVALKRSTTVWQSFVAICRNCLAQLEANAPVAREGRDPEGIHQARVAIRRLRAAFKVFKPVLSEEKRVFFAKDLRWLQRQLGDARDLDVFLGEMLDPMRAHLPKDPALIALRGRVVKARAAAQVRAQKALESRRYGRLRLELERWFAEPLGADADPALSRSVRWFARRSIRKANDKMIAAGDDLAGLSEAKLHALRIRGKQVRYCVEFFASLFAEKGPRRHARLLARLQDCLGGLNDSAVANEVLTRLERAGGPLDPRAKANVVGWFAARIHEERKNLDRIWARLSDVDAYWASR